MAYIGNNLTVQQYAPQIAYFTGNGTATSFTLPSPVVSAGQIIVTVNNVVQNPTYAYSVSGSTLTFTSAPPANSTTPQNIWVEYTSLQTSTVAPSAGTVGISQLSALGTPSSSTFLRGDNTWAATTLTYAVNALVVGGGGGGGGATYCGGGGGAGGFVQAAISVIPGTVYNVVVGSGGAAATANGSVPNAIALQGGGSSFGPIFSLGGGGGPSWTSSNGLMGGSGGSGGGGGPSDGGSAGLGGISSSGQGYAGGTGYVGSGVNAGGGGGGAGAVGGNAASNTGGNGGNGLTTNIITTTIASTYSVGQVSSGSVYFSGGGGGGAVTTRGTGGLGGGGAGGQGSGNGTAGTANTGGGGGGGSYSTGQGASGGSGVVILSIPTTNYSGTTTGSPTVTTNGSNTILIFKSSGSYTA